MRAPLDPTRKFSEGGAPEHRAALGIDCPACHALAGEWCPMPGTTWALCGERIVAAIGNAQHEQSGRATAEFLAMLDAVQMPLTEPDLMRLRGAFYALPENLSGGSLHVVLDDGNWEREHVEFCRGLAADRGDVAGERLAGLLLTLSDEQLRVWLGPGNCPVCLAEYGDPHAGRFDTPDRRCPECGSRPLDGGRS